MGSFKQNKESERLPMKFFTYAAAIALQAVELDTELEMGIGTKDKSGRVQECEAPEGYVNGVDKAADIALYDCASNSLNDVDNAWMTCITYTWGWNGPSDKHASKVKASGWRLEQLYVWNNADRPLSELTPKEKKRLKGIYKRDGQMFFYRGPMRQAARLANKIGCKGLEGLTWTADIDDPKHGDVNNWGYID